MVPQIRRILEDYEIEIAVIGELVVNLSNWQAKYFLLLTPLMVILGVADFLIFRALANRGKSGLTWLAVGTIPPFAFAFFVTMGLLLPYWLQTD